MWLRRRIGLYMPVIWFEEGTSVSSAYNKYNFYAISTGIESQSIWAIEWLQPNFGILLLCMVYIFTENWVRSYTCRFNFGIWNASFGTTLADRPHVFTFFYSFFSSGPSILLIAMPSWVFAIFQSMLETVVSQVKALDKAISGKAAGSSQKALDVDDTSPIALLALEGPLLAQP